jgi:DNA polymerase
MGSPIENLKRLLELEILMGVDFIPVVRNKNNKATKEGLNPRIQDEFTVFREKILKCTRCPLHKGRTQVVFGCGNLKAPLLFVGEAPGYEEDIKGEPFVGRAGKLLTESLKKLGVSREDVYIANIMKCRPPENRQPRLDEIVICVPYLYKQIGFIKPKIVCALGGVAAQILLGTDVSVTKLRGRLEKRLDMDVFPMFHPAYILRNPRETPIFEQDLEKVCRLAGLI